MEVADIDADGMVLAVDLIEAGIAGLVDGTATEIAVAGVFLADGVDGHAARSSAEAA
jgi:hypothetical protein